MKLYDFPDSFNAARARAVAFELGLEPEIVPVNLMAGEHRQPAHRARHPLGLVPVLEDADMVLTESFAIARYFAELRPGLLPDGARRRAEVDRWLFFSSFHLTPAVVKVFRQRCVVPLFGVPTDDVVVAQGMQELAEVLPVLDAVLADRSWLAGELSLADPCTAATLSGRNAARIDLSSYPAIERWLDRLAERRSWQRAFTGCGMLAP
jgi:glutathione S-transferase